MHPPTHFLFAQTPVDRRHVRLQSERLARRYALRALHSPAAHDLATDKTGEHYFLKPLPVDWTREHSLMVCSTSDHSTRGADGIRDEGEMGGGQNVFKLYKMRQEIISGAILSSCQRLIGILANAQGSRIFPGRGDFADGMVYSQPLDASFTANPTLYQKITEYFAALLTEPTMQCDGLLDDALLRHYAVAWDKYKTCARIIDRQFEYFNRHCVKFVRNKGKKVYPVYTVALIQWRLHFLLHIQGDDMKLTSAILHLIEKQRAGATIDEDVIKTVVDSFVSLGIDEHDLKNTSYDVYQKHFETPFLDMMEQSYRRESEAFLAANDVMKSVEGATQRLDEEDIRVERYLQPSTCKLLITRCEEVFIREHEKLLQEYLQHLIAQDDKDNSDIDRIRALLGRISDVTESVKQDAESSDAGVESM
ncbi:Cullin-1 [Grifola frondosa]|uniref:Cullin-1 n=1 Tax=Grifola frondosa TaxID=5627 RepID=A0A1C7LN13_GRIFR|nr:Cullin-1 [Grifola frondosa]